MARPRKIGPKTKPVEANAYGSPNTPAPTSVFVIFTKLLRLLASRLCNIGFLLASKIFSIDCTELILSRPSNDMSLNFHNMRLKYTN